MERAYRARPPDPPDADNEDFLPDPGIGLPRRLDKDLGRTLAVEDIEGCFTEARSGEEIVAGFIFYLINIAARAVAGSKIVAIGGRVEDLDGEMGIAESEHIAGNIGETYQKTNSNSGRSGGLSAKPSRYLKPCGFAWVFKYCLRRFGARSASSFAPFSGSFGVAFAHPVLRLSRHPLSSLTQRQKILRVQHVEPLQMGQPHRVAPTKSFMFFLP